MGAPVYSASPCLIRFPSYPALSPQIFAKPVSKKKMFKCLLLWICISVFQPTKASIWCVFLFLPLMSPANNVKLRCLKSRHLPLLQMWPRFHSPSHASLSPSHTLPVCPPQLPSPPPHPQGTVNFSRDLNKMVKSRSRRAGGTLIFSSPEHNHC